MKKVVIPTLLSGISLAASGQPVTLPAPYNSEVKINYVRTFDAIAPITDSLEMLTRPSREVRQTTQYFDGLGRPLQTVVKEGSMVTGETPKDLVSAHVYDGFGLPYMSLN